MTKSEILVIVQRMENDWQAAIDGNEAAIQNCYNGFCFWSCYVGNLGEMEDFFVMVQLQKDHNRRVNKDWYWYPTYNNQGSSALKPRLDHLNRTIARLENEIKTSL